MKTSKKNLLIGLAIFAVAFIAVVVFVATSASGAVQTLSDTIKSTETPAVQPVLSNGPEIPESSENQPPESAPDAPQSVQTYQQPIVTPNAEQQQQEEPQLERIPCTHKPVTAGDPESYVDTYGQCPFYENAGPKGCFPPPDVECNADWSKCEYIGNKQ